MTTEVTLFPLFQQRISPELPPSALAIGRRGTVAALHDKTPSTGTDGSGIEFSPIICFRLISMVREMAVKGTSCGRFSNGVSRSRPILSNDRNMKPTNAEPTGVQ